MNTSAWYCCLGEVVVNTSAWYCCLGELVVNTSAWYCCLGEVVVNTTTGQSWSGHRQINHKVNHLLNRCVQQAE